MSFYSTITDTMQTSIDNSLLFQESFGGLNGFEELKKYIRQGSDFCKDIAFIIQERADLESTYSKGLSKVAGKLSRASQNSTGSLTDGWKAVSSCIEVEAELHKNLATALLEDIAKPLKHLVDGQHKARKPIELSVDKALKSLTDKRTEENKAKKSAYDCAKSHEKAEEAKQGKAKTEKDINKTEKKQKQVLDALRKADKHYCETCEKAEVARQEWDFAVNKANAQLQALEEERIAKMNDFLNQYNSHLSMLAPKLTQSCEKLHQSVLSVDIAGDIRNAAKQRSTHYTPEQILIDCYAEDKQFSMKQERRKLALQHYLLQIRQSIEREQKGREGVEKLVDVYRERPNFADADAQEEARQRLNQVIFMTNFLEANHYKIASYLAEMDRSHKPAHKFSKYIEQTRDKQGMVVSVLRLPMNLACEGHTGYDVTNVTIGALASDEPFDDDDFDDDPSLEPQNHRIIGRCKVVYDYQPDQANDLVLQSGDVINIYDDKQPDGWWQGELNGKVGMFPATYVQKI
ncbi:nostrin-like isoform X2 [Ruditapes philippinarum]|uniref:nostrin-like isoform X2 n=1 Tax=Ruditapes philippinarum TaxID=129788 RepID=UPI00295B81D6|nr:nostrin-like isoform X2 [Ruditapes philippinarum]